MIKAIIFDADGVLVFRPEYFSQRLKLSEDIVKKFFRGVFQDCLVGKADLKAELPKFMREWGWQGSVDDLMKLWFDAESKLNHELVNYVKELKAKGSQVYIGTNNEKHRTGYLKDIVGLGEIVHKIYGSGHVGYMKPDHKFFNHILKDNHLNPSEVLFFDDDSENVHAALELGMHAEVYKDFIDFRRKIIKYIK